MNGHGHINMLASHCFFFKLLNFSYSETILASVSIDSFILDLKTVIYLHENLCEKNIKEFPLMK